MGPLPAATPEGKQSAILYSHLSESMSCRQNKHFNHEILMHGENPSDFSVILVLSQITLVVLITHAVRFLLKPLKQPKIVSQIIGGIIVGPSVLGQNKKFAARMFPEKGTFVLSNISVLGVMYFLFASGVRMDTSMIRKVERKQFVISLVGVLIPFATVTAVSISLWNSFDGNIAQPTSVGAIASSLSITAFPVLYHVLKDLNLLNSEMGRFAMSTSMISDALGWNAVVVFEAAKRGSVSKWDALWYLISLFALLAFYILGIRRALLWIIRRTPKGKPVGRFYINMILLGVCVLGFVSDMIGATIVNGPLWLGLIVPDGPPLGSILVDKCDTIVNELLMPLLFARIGLGTDVFSLTVKSGRPNLRALFIVVFAGYFAKLIATLTPAILFKLPVKEAITLSLLMSLRGQVELFVFLHWYGDYKILNKQTFTMMVLLTAFFTAIVTPLITILYKPTRPYMIRKRRTIQHAMPGIPIHMVACIHDPESVPAFIQLLEASNPTTDSPFLVYALHLVELSGRAYPMFIDHEKDVRASPSSSSEVISNALKIYEQTSGTCVKIFSFTAVVPHRTMYQDICELALERKASLIVLPYRGMILGDQLKTGTGSHHGTRSVNSSVLAHAPCSVGILVTDQGPHHNLVSLTLRRSSQHVALLFLGGADAREALAYADRMARNPTVTLTVVRFLSDDNAGDDEVEKKLDDMLMTWFWVKNEGNDRVIYREVVVSNGEETLAAIQAMNDNSYNLWIVGRQQGMNPALVQGLTEWSENPELGVIGEYVSSADFSGTASVLVVQQQVLRGDLDKQQEGIPVL